MQFHRVLSFVFAVAGLAPAVHAAGLPALFEQHSPGLYRIRGNAYSVAIHGNGMTLTTAGGAAQLTWLGTRGSSILPLEPQAARVNYLSGADRSAWKTGLSTFSRLRAQALYPGIDVVYYGAASQLEYDFVVKPGADPNHIQFSLPAALNSAGELVLPNGLRWRKPVAKQDGREIAARFEKRGPDTFGISVGDYDRTRQLVIDPVLTYSTYVGGSLADEVRGVAADAAGSVYVVGSTVSSDFPGTTRGQTFGAQDVFVAKLNPSGRALEWATYIGGSGSDSGAAIALDAAGAIYITGQTASTNFPVTTGVFQPALAGGSAVTDAYVLKLAANGRDIVYSTYLGGAQSDSGAAIAVDRAGSAYVAGRADSTDFPSTTREALPPRGAGDGFVTKLSPDGSAIVYSSLLGGFALDVINAIAIDTAGAAYVAGETRSDNFPVTASAYLQERRGNSDAFITKLAVDGASLTYSSYFGGDGQEGARAIAVDRLGNAYITGITGSANLPISFNGAQRTPALLPDAFVAKFDPAGSSLVYGTYIGGDAEEQANAIIVDSAGSAYIAGQTSSVNFPFLNDGPLAALESRGGVDGFVTKVSSGGNFFQFSTFFGGGGTDAIAGMASDGRGRIWIGGVTDSTNLRTTTGSLAVVAPGATDGFVALLSEIFVTVTPGVITLGPRDTQQFTALVSNAVNSSVRWSIFPDLGTISQTGLYTAPAVFTGTPAVTVSAISAADGTKIGQATVTLENRVSVAVLPAGVSLFAGGTQQFSASVIGTPNTAVTWSITPSIGTISASGLYTAPASFLAEAAVTVRAVSVAETSRFGTAVVNLTLTPAAPPPAITTAGIANAASFRGASVDGGIAPGEIVTIFGTNLGPAVPVTLQLDGRGFVANRLGGTRVLFDGTPAAMIVTSAGQVSAVVPYGVEGLGAVAVSVEYDGRVSNSVPIPVAASAPGIFTQNSSGSGLGSVIRQNGELISQQSPAGPGEILTLFATGDGATNPAGIDGKPTAAPLPLPKLPVKLVIDGVEYDPLYAGGAPGLVAGVLQVNFSMPGGAAGSRRLRLKIGDKLSPDTVTIFGR